MGESVMHTPHQDEHYKKTLYDLQVELVKLQRNLIAGNARVLIILEGRDAAGKDAPSSGSPNT
jgi:polyphosphate kinase 2 (PPK2 family)